MSRNKKEAYKNIYTCACIANINKEISEDRYIVILQKLSAKGFKTYHINDFTSFIEKLRTVGLYDSFNISLLMHMRDLAYKKISEISLIFDVIGEIFSFKKKTMIERIKNISDLLKIKLELIHAFKLIDNISSKLDLMSDSKCNFINKSSILEKNQQNRFESHTRYEIINRLHLLAQKHYTLPQLKYMNVKLIHISEIENMTNDLLQNYYTHVTNEIESNIKDWIMLCKNYIDIEINYIEYCEKMIKGEPTHLYVKDNIMDKYFH